MNKDKTKLKQFLDQRPLPEKLLNWITEVQLLQFLNIRPTTLKNWRSLRKIGYTKINGIILYDVDDLIAQIEKGRVRRR